MSGVATPLTESPRSENPAVSDTRPAAEAEDMPLPTNPQTVFLGGLFFLAALAALYVSRVVVLPVVLALVLKLFLQPLVRFGERFRVPRPLGALVAVLLLLAILGALGTALTGPAASWASKLPAAVPKLGEEFAWVKEPAGRVQEMMRSLGLGGGEAPSPGSLVKPEAILGAVASGAGGFASHLLETLLILFYLLVFGETFMRRVVEVLPHFRDKRQAVEISTHIERDLSAYLGTVSAINAVVGLATGTIFWFLGIPDPILWGTAAFCLNFIPILGPFAGVVLFTAVGVLARGAEWGALLPAALYFCVHVLEGEIFTPMLLAHRFTINPVAVMLALVFWYWMWGVEGAVLAVPMLAITKIVCDRLRPFRAIGHLLEG